MKHKYAIAGIVASILFVISYVILSSIRPEYSHYTKAISELGSVDAPNKWLWNIFGYIIPGFLIAFFSKGLNTAINPNGSGKIPYYGILLSGLFMALAGIFPGDFDNRSSLTMVVHTIGSLGSFIFFLIGAFGYPKQMMKRSPFWKQAILPSLILVWLSIISGFFRSGSMPGIGQRIGFLFYFLWILYMTYKLLKYKRLKI